MIRAFVAIDFPEEQRAQLGRLQDMLPLPRPEPEENLHLTLAFLGNLAEPVLEEVHFALDALRAPPFTLNLVGAGLFGGARPHLAYAAALPDPALVHLQAKVETAARRAGAEVERRRFVPHVTLGRFDPRTVDLPRLERAVANAAAVAISPIEVRDFVLFRSDLGRHGAQYTELARYGLTA